jgi:c-di-GMP-binding flagellar brake protein YcgR
MPVNLRLYDHDKQLYRVWGLVQHCHGVSSEDFTGYNVGVAFVGKEAPASFYDNPDQSYRIVGLNEDGLWTITEAEREFINRRHPRFWVSLDGFITVVSDEGEETELEAVTENISKSGAAVFCETEAIVGDMVRFSCPQYEFISDAVVRNRRGNGNTTPKLHLEFLENEFPVEKLNQPFEE